MDEPTTSALQYGHLGRAVYHPETQTWAFSRTLTQSPRISYGGSTKATVPSPLTAPPSSLIENKSLLPRVHPELAACWSLVDNETLSHVITTTSEICDPLVSSLFDLGNAVDIENDDSGSRVVPIAVVASGECGNAISFRKIEESTVELRQEMTTSMRVPSIGESESIEWSAGGAPVRQICFARTVEEKATWMVARFPHSTTVFRPLYHRKPVPMHIYRDGDRVLPNNTRNSRLDANPLIEISSAQTGGFAHADVTFNPWYQKQFAIVDERGNWSIWEISGRHKRKGNWTAACVKSGSLPWRDIDDSQGLDDHPRHDGWAAIEWAGDVNSFVVSDRRCTMLYRMESDQLLPYLIELGLKRKSEWVLDIKRSACNVSHIFILTTSRIFWLDVTLGPIPDSQSQADTTPSLCPRLSWRHFRDPEDMTLRLAPLLMYEDFYFVLYSRLNRLTLAFQIPFASEGQSDIESVPDPFILNIPSISDESSESQISPNEAQFSTLVFRQITHLPSSVGKRYYDPNARLIKLFILDSRLAVRESVYVGPTSDGDVEDHPLGKDVLRLRKRYPGVQRKQSSRFHDDFIVDDWDESVLSTGTFTIPDAGISSITPLAIPQWTMDYTSIYAVATGKLMAVSNEVDQDSDKGFQESIKDLADKIFSTTLSSQPASPTMLEVLGRSPVLDDIDQNAQHLASFLSQIMSYNSDPGNQFHIAIQQPLNLSSSPSTGQSGLPEPSEVNLIDTYDRLVNDWLANLPHDIPGRTRITKEKIIRSVAAELILTRIIIMLNPNHGSDESRTSESGRQINEVDSSSASDIIGRRALSLPAAPSDDLQVASIDTAGQNDQATSITTPIYSSLSSFTTFNRGSISPSVANILSHWQPGADPAGYSWQRTVQVLEEEESQRTTKATTPKRRLRKKTSQTVTLDSSQPLPMTPLVPVVREWGSQPEGGEPSRAIRLQSSQAIEEDFPMSQVERGLFGGREASRKTVTKARKKKRAAGF